MKDEIGSLYWVISHRCNSQCDHCYMDCGPGSDALSFDEARAVIDNLPDRINYQIILSGGEVLHPKNRDLLFFVADGLQKKYGHRPLAIQTNGDFLNEKIIDDCVHHNITHLSIASMDEHHRSKYGSIREKRRALRSMLKGKGLVEMHPTPVLTPGKVARRSRLLKAVHMVAKNIRFKPSFTFWGANEEIWLKGNWARGRALKNGKTLYHSSHNFCNLWSGGLNFLKTGSPLQEVAVQLSYAFPCCPCSRVALADLREEQLVCALERASRHSMFRAINIGRPYLGASRGGLTPSGAHRRWKELKNICQMCDEIIVQQTKGEFPLSPLDIYSN
ncbi:MAG: radical SAM protein [Deltaproteobacteria bacterium]|nr:radical SAM protein [Deltaproteobacteria bacterium]